MVRALLAAAFGAALVLAPVQARRPEEAAALAADDECLADDGSCSLSAIQLRGQKAGEGELPPQIPKVTPDKGDATGPEPGSLASDVKEDMLGAGPLPDANGLDINGPVGPDEADENGHPGMVEVATGDEKASEEAKATDAALLQESEATPSSSFKASPEVISAEALLQEATPSSTFAATEGKVEGNESLLEAGTCGTDTFGSCTIRSCHESRGATSCSWGKCKCAPGWCAMNGACYPTQSARITATGGSCSVLGCSSSRGATDCVSGQCVCQAGHFAYKGKCYPVSDTGGSCKLMWCSSSRGPTTCAGGKCICKEGYVAMDGRCSPLKY